MDTQIYICDEVSKLCLLNKDKQLLELFFDVRFNLKENKNVFTIITENKYIFDKSITLRGGYSNLENNGIYYLIIYENSTFVISKSDIFTGNEIDDKIKVTVNYETRLLALQHKHKLLCDLFFNQVEIPKHISSNNVIKIMCDKLNLYILTEVNELYGIGNNSFGQLASYYDFYVIDSQKNRIFYDTFILINNNTTDFAFINSTLIYTFFRNKKYLLLGQGKNDYNIMGLTITSLEAEDKFSYFTCVKSPFYILDCHFPIRFICGSSIVGLVIDKDLYINLPLNFEVNKSCVNLEENYNKIYIEVRSGKFVESTSLQDLELIYTQSTSYTYKGLGIKSLFGTFARYFQFDVSLYYSNFLFVNFPGKKLVGFFSKQKNLYYFEINNNEKEIRNHTLVFDEDITELNEQNKVLCMTFETKTVFIQLQDHIDFLNSHDFLSYTYFLNKFHLKLNYLNYKQLSSQNNKVLITVYLCIRKLKLSGIFSRYLIYMIMDFYSRIISL